MDVDSPARSSGEDRSYSDEMMRYYAFLSPPRMPSPRQQHLVPMDFDFPFMDEEEMQRVLASLSPLRMPLLPSPSPPGLRLWEFDDEHTSPPQTALSPAPADHAAAAALVSAPGSGYGENTDPLKKKLIPIIMHIKKLILYMKCMFYMDSRRAGESGIPFKFEGPEWTLNVRHYSSVEDLRNQGPEWTLNVRHYSSVEDLRNHATDVDRGSVAISVFDPLTQSCIAVVGLTVTSQKMNYESAVDEICKSLRLFCQQAFSLPKQRACSLKVLADGDFGPLQFGVMLSIGIEDLKETDAQNPESGHCESPLVLDTKMMQGNTENAAASIDVVQHHPSAQPTNSPKSKLRSEAWKHFRKDGARAYCKHCTKDYAADSKKHGTSRLFKHLEDVHQIYLRASSSKNGK